MSVGDVGSGERGSLAHLSSNDLLRRGQAGDSRALDRLFTRYAPRLRRWAHGRMPRLGGWVVDTTDLVQDAMLHALRRIPVFRPNRDSALLGYLRRALLNRIRDQVRHGSRRPAAVPLEEHHALARDSPLADAIDQENRERYLKALKRLRAKDRNAIIARVDLGYSYDQLALILRTPNPEAARLAVRRALLRLAREMTRV